MSQRNSPFTPLPGHGGIRTPPPGFPGKHPGCPRNPHAPSPVSPSPTSPHSGPPHAPFPARKARPGRGGQGGRQGGTREIRGFPGGQTRVQRGHPGALRDFPTEHPRGTPRFSRGLPVLPGIFHSVKLGLQSGAVGFLGFPGVSPGVSLGIPGKSRRHLPAQARWWGHGIRGYLGSRRRNSVRRMSISVDISWIPRGESRESPGRVPVESREIPGRVLGMPRGVLGGNKKIKKYPALTGGVLESPG